MKTTLRPIVLGCGALNWPRGERVSDRYGVVFLNRNSGGYHAATAYREVGRYHEGQKGRLVAVILEARQSSHIGDLFHGVFPRTPEVGQEIVLGEGTLFYETNPDMNGLGVGVLPDDGRERLWLNIRALYDCHDQTVELRFIPSA